MAGTAPDPFDAAEEAAAALGRITGVDHHDVAVVLGSGWAEAAGSIGEVVATASMDDLPGLPAPTVGGHRGELWSMRVAGRAVLVLGGRSHLYEGHGPDVVVHGVRAAVIAGCTTVLLTNAAGSLRPEWGPGTPVLISDQLNLSGTTPMGGPPPPDRFDGRFADMTDLYSPHLREVARMVDADLPEGVYAGMLGGAYETPAEIRMLQTLGADLVGMSTVLEAIAARHLGASLLGVSLVTNLAAGMAPAKLDHADVLEAGRAARGRVAELLRGVLEQL